MASIQPPAVVAGWQPEQSGGSAAPIVLWNLLTSKPSGSDPRPSPTVASMIPVLPENTWG